MRNRNTEQRASSGWVSRQTAALFLAISLAAPTAQSQQQSERGTAQRPGSETQARASVRPPDIISDNLDRVAASADQILEVLNKETGLMVELKRLLAKDAGASGQILEESDLTDAAVAERLRSDLRSRVLATRLLQRYGYLVPRVNPDSDLEAEQKLVRQERAQMIARAAERLDNSKEGSPAGQNAACDPQRSAECARQTTLLQDFGDLPVGPIAPGSAPRPSTPLQRAENMPQTDIPLPDGMSISPNQRSEYSASLGSAETGLAAVRAGTSAQRNASSMMQVDGGRDPLSVPPAQPDLETSTILQLEQTTAAPGLTQTGRRVTPASSLGAESVRMVRQRNPYANVPSLYDLYVQAGADSRPLERFGLDVFRSGATNPSYLPMDLPAGPNYVVGPGDSLSIDMWGGMSQRVLRIVDREGRVTLPDAGPILVSGRTLGDVQQELQRFCRRLTPPLADGPALCHR
jgi:hypothetical protein